MNTHYMIELPPLPDWMSRFQIPADDLDDSDFSWLDCRMKDYARSAVEADRKRRGEPAERKRRYAQGTALGEFGIIPMCDQVDAEPVKVPSDADILDLWTGDTTHSRPVMGKKVK